jgi:hypothetical protein
MEDLVVTPEQMLSTLKRALASKRAAADHIADSGKMVETRWIPVSERLPEDRVSVLTCGEDPVDGGFMLIGHREPESKFGPAHWHLPGFSEFGPVSHWMPLPPPPTE